MEEAANSVQSLLKNNTSLSDYFTSQFANLTPWKVLIGLVMGALVGIIIAFVYKRCYRGVLYSPSFALTLIMLTLITTPVVMCIKSDIALSMGMVGALSIVRFRTAVKDPMDLVFLFWAISVGIICGAGFAMIAVIASVVLTIIIVLLSIFRTEKNYMVLVVNATEYIEDQIIDVVSSRCHGYKVRARNLTKGNVNLAIEVKTPHPHALVEDMMRLSDVTSVSLLEHDGEVTA